MYIIQNYRKRSYCKLLFITFYISCVSLTFANKDIESSQPSSDQKNSALEQCYLAYNHVYNDLKNNVSQAHYQYMAKILTLACRYDILC